LTVIFGIVQMFFQMHLVDTLPVNWYTDAF